MKRNRGRKRGPQPEGYYEFRIVDSLGRPGLWCSEKRMAKKLSGELDRLLDGLEGYAIDRRYNSGTATRWPMSQLDLMALTCDNKVIPL